VCAYNSPSLKAAKADIDCHGNLLQIPMWSGSHMHRLYCPDPEGAHYTPLTINPVSTDLRIYMKEPES